MDCLRGWWRSRWGEVDVDPSGVEYVRDCIWSVTKFFETGSIWLFCC